MKTIKTLIMLFLLGTVSAAAREYANRVVKVDEADAFKAGSLIDITKESSSAIQKIDHFAYWKAFKGDFITGITYSGYNLGKEVKKHFKVWVSDMEMNSSFDGHLVYDKDYSIPSGGSEVTPIPLIALEFDTPYELGDGIYFYVRIECTGDAADNQLNFEFCSQKNRTVASISVMSEVKYLTGTVCNQDGLPVAGAHIQVSYSRSGAEYYADTDDNGRYTLRVEESNHPYPVVVSAPGYSTYTGQRNNSTPSDNTIVTLNGEHPTRDFTLFSAVAFKKDRRSTIILPVAPNPDWGRYYRLASRTMTEVVFEYEAAPKANTPYIIFPYKDFELSIEDYNFDREPESIVLPWPEGSSLSNVQFATMYGSYKNEDIMRTYDVESIMLLDDSSDCDNNGMPVYGRIGACRAYLVLLSAWPYNIEVSYPITQFIRFAGEPTTIKGIEATTSQTQSTYDLQGRRIDGQPRQGVYIRDGRKVVVK